MARRDEATGGMADRRGFIAAGAALAATGLAPAAARARDTGRRRVAIIGSTGRGDYGHGLDVAFTKVPGVEIVAVADEHAAGRAAARDRTGAARDYADFSVMLAEERPDIVAVCPRWIDQHHDMLLAAAGAGAHVYMEKPFCPTLAECDRVVEEFARRRLKLGIAHISQYSPVLDVVRSLIEHDEIGTVLEVRARGKEDRRGGGEDLWVLGSHVLGLMRSLAGGDALSCTALVRHAGEPVTAAHVTAGAEGIGPLAGDDVQARFAFAGGAYGHFASRRDAGGRPSRFGIQVCGSKGVIEMESGYLRPAWLLRDAGWSTRSGARWEPITSAGIGRPEDRTDGSYEGGHLAAIGDLVGAIEEDRATRCSAEDARAITEMIAAVFESHRVRGPVALPLATRVNPLTLL
jgi:predicted dehydrogenase